MYSIIIKQILDILFAIILFIILFPLLILISLILLVILKNTFIFKQNRAGLNGKTFCLYKFKTMRDLYNEDNELLPENERIFKFGKFLRKSSLDEIPSLFNVIKGDMSFVGPRPLLVQYLPLYSKKQMQRHNATPGITGWAQVNGRNSINWDEKFKLDLYYVNNKNFLLDLKIIFMTFKTILFKNDINNSNEISMPLFNGNKK